MPADHSPRRITCLQPSATAILAAIGALDRIVACTKYCVDICPEIATAGRTIVDDSWTASSEQIASVRPDLVIASVPYQEKSVAEILRSGIPFLGLAPKTLADVYADIAMIAGIVGRAEPGERVIENMKREIDAVAQKTSGLCRSRVLCEEWGKPIIQSQPWVAELVHAAGGEFLGTPAGKLSANEIAACNPDVIVAAWCGAGDRVPLRKIIQDRHWQEIPAARNGRVYCIRDEFLNTPAPTLTRGLHALAAAIHPEIFPETTGLRCIMSESPSTQRDVSPISTDAP